MYTGADPEELEDGGLWGEWLGEEDVTDVTVADGVTEIKPLAFYGCEGLTNLGFLKGSAVTTVGEQACRDSGIIALQGMEGVRNVGFGAFYGCKDLRAVEGLGCEEMGDYCFTRCTLLQSMKGWPASMTYIPRCTFYRCAGMTTVDCDLSHATSIGANAFCFCTSLLPSSLSRSQHNADPRRRPRLPEEERPRTSARERATPSTRAFAARATRRRSRGRTSPRPSSRSPWPSSPPT
jgi:hypothetical protein